MQTPDKDDSTPARHHLKFRQLRARYAILKLQPETPIPAWAANGEFTSITRASNELSIVCPAENVPQNLHSPERWICLKLEGPFAFSLTGVLLSFIGPLSRNGVPIFALSTYDTDYVLIQEEFAQTAVSILQQAGHELIP